MKQLQFFDWDEGQRRKASGMRRAEVAASEECKIDGWFTLWLFSRSRDADGQRERFVADTVRAYMIHELQVENEGSWLFLGSLFQQAAELKWMIKQPMTYQSKVPSNHVRLQQVWVGCL